MKCGHCREYGVDIAHVRACSEQLADFGTAEATDGSRDSAQPAGQAVEPGSQATSPQRANEDAVDDRTCPKCPRGGEPVGEPGDAGWIEMRCQTCATRWTRMPRVSCPRCGQSDIETVTEWRYISTDGKWHPNPGPGDIEKIEVPIARCPGCNNVWSPQGP